MEREREELLVQTEALLAVALARADHDPLTGLLNHRAFHKRLQEEEKEGVGAGGAVLLVDPRKLQVLQRRLRASGGRRRFAPDFPHLRVGLPGRRRAGPVRRR